MLPESLTQAEYTGATANSTSEDRCNKQEGSDAAIHESHGHTLLRGKGLPSLEIVGENAWGGSGREVCQVLGGKMRIDFRPADRLHFQSENLTLDSVYSDV